MKNSETQHIGTRQKGTKCYVRDAAVHLSVHIFFTAFKENVSYRIFCMNKQKMMSFLVACVIRYIVAAVQSQLQV